MKYQKHTFCLYFIILAIDGFGQSNSSMQMLVTPFTPLSTAWTEASVAYGFEDAAGLVNPALAGSGATNTATVAQTLWTEVSTTSFLGTSLKKKALSWQFSLVFNEVGEIEARTTPGPANGTFAATYAAVSTAISYDFELLRAGFSASYLNENIYTENAGGYSFGFGLQSSLADERIFLGASLMHLGRMNPLLNQRSPLPIRLQFGILSHLVQLRRADQHVADILVSPKFDVIVPMGDEADLPETKPYVSVGGTVEIDRIQLRGGWRSGDTIRPWSAGVALRFGTWSAEYALAPHTSGFSRTHAIGLRYRF